MADTKKPSYQIAFESRQAQIENQIQTEHKHERPIESPQDEIKPGKGSQQLLEGAQ